jgi:hypothetical protein
LFIDESIPGISSNSFCLEKVYDVRLRKESPQINEIIFIGFTLVLGVGGYP